MATGDKIFLADKPTQDAIKTTTDSINTKVGATGDSGGSTSAGSIFAKLNKLLSDWTAARAAKIDTIDTNVSGMNTRWNAEKANQIHNIDAYTATNNTPSATGTLSQKMSKAIADIAGINTAINNKGMVKSIQRGIMGAATTSDDTHAITISAVNPAKCVVSFENRISSGDNRMSFAPEFVSLTATVLTVRRPLFNGTPTASAMWQIVEYY